MVYDLSCPVEFAFGVDLKDGLMSLLSWFIICATHTNFPHLKKMDLERQKAILRYNSHKCSKGHVHLYLGVNNLLDIDYENSYGYPQEGRFIYGGVVFNN